MSAIERHVIVNITAETSSPTQAGFGTPLIITQDVPASFISDYVREYGSLAELADAGFSLTGKTYALASAMMSQNPRPPTFKIGRRALKDTETVTLTPSVQGEGYVHSITIGGLVASYTELSGDVLADITAGLTAAITALTTTVAVTATDNSTSITVAVDVAGAAQVYESWSASILFEDVTTDPGILTDLTAILAEDGDFYGVLCDSESRIIQAAVASWALTSRKLYGIDSADDDLYDGAVTDDIASVIQTSSNTYTPVFYKGKDTWNFIAPGLFGAMLPTKPGEVQWGYKTIRGVNSVPLQEGKKTALEAKNANWYSVVAGVAVTYPGWTGGGEWIDITRGIDALQARIQEGVFGTLISSPKVPYTETGADMIKSPITAALTSFTATESEPARLLAADPPFTVSTPAISTVPAVDKNNRILRNVKFGGTLAGAIIKTVIDGNLSV